MSYTAVPNVYRLRSEVMVSPNGHGVEPVRRRPPRRSAVPSDALNRYVLPDLKGPFHFTRQMSLLCHDIVSHVPELSHINVDKILVTFVRSRSPQNWGIQAKLVPLRFPGGELVALRRGTRYHVQRFFVDHTEMMHVLAFYLPRFLNQSFAEKLITVFHELYHIHPSVPGDLRRDGERMNFHGRSRKQYDHKMADLARKYLHQHPPRELYDFLKLTFADIEAHFGSIVGLNVPAPKLIPER